MDILWQELGMKDEAENKKVTSLNVLLFLKGSCSLFLMEDVLTDLPSF